RGEAKEVERARPFFDDVSAHFTLMGASGAGMVAKMLNQLIVGCGHAIMAEAIVLSEAAGTDAGRLPECLAAGRRLCGCPLPRVSWRRARRRLAVAEALPAHAAARFHAAWLCAPGAEGS